MRHLWPSLFLLGSCWTGNPAKPDAGPLVDTGPSPPPLYDANVKSFCQLPGSVRFDGVVKDIVPGAKGLPDISWMNIPAGFCVHYFATVPNARSLRFAPGGELFASSPTRGTTGGGPGGRAAIIVLPDDNGDGLADSTNPFATNLGSTTGMLFTNGWFYYQDDTKILRTPYSPGDRALKQSMLVADLGMRYASGVHWPKPLDVADDGTIYVGNGSDQGEVCVEPHQFVGGVYSIGDGKPMNGEPIISGFRNPIYVRCQRGHNNCFSVELTRDYSAGMGGREKIVPIRKGDDWGYPCCATKNQPYPDSPQNANCSMVPAEDVAFYVADTPFGFDFEPGRWPAPWTNRLFATLHGAFGTWVGARIVAIEIDGATGLPKKGGTLLPDGGQGTAGAAIDFATGWDDNKLDHGRPADATFASDGRMFVAQDTGPESNGSLGIVVWFAPLDLPKP